MLFIFAASKFFGLKIIRVILLNIFVCFKYNRIEMINDRMIEFKVMISCS